MGTTVTTSLAVVHPSQAGIALPPGAVALAAAPLLAALVFLLVARLSGARAGLLAWGLAVVVALAPGPYRLDGSALLGASLKGFLLSLIVLYVLLAGLLLYNLLERAGAITAIARGLGTAARDPARRALVIVGGLSPFFESVSGFGLAVVVVAPLLLALGFGRRRATLLALLGQNAVPWGAMAIGTLIGAELVGMPARTIGVGSAYLNGPLAFVYDALVVVVAAGAPAVLRRLPDVALSAAALAAGVWVCSRWVSVELAGVLAGLLAAAAELAYARWVERRAGWHGPAGTAPRAEAGPAAEAAVGAEAGAGAPARAAAGAVPATGAEAATGVGSGAGAAEAGAAAGASVPPEGLPAPAARRAVSAGSPAAPAEGDDPPAVAAGTGRGTAGTPMPAALAFVPYYVLIAGLLASRLVPPLAAWLQARLVLEAPAYGFRLPLVYSPGFFLLLACAAAVVAFRLPAPAVGRALAATLRQWWPAAGATAAFLMLSTVMYAAGMTPHLAAAAAAAAGSEFAFASPFVGGLGGLMTGSNTGGNAMLIQFQVEAARRAGLPPEVLAVANNVAAANATMASPPRVALAAAVTGQAGQEGRILRSALVPVAAALAVIAVQVGIWARLR